MICREEPISRILFRIVGTLFQGFTVVVLWYLHSSEGCGEDDSIQSDGNQRI